MLQHSKDARKQEIEYERLSEFFFDLCLSLCQHLDIETYIFFLNGIFMNITQGSHVNVSTFKEIEQIEVLSVEFFNRLLNYRNRCEENLQQGQTYADWYAKNFVDLNRSQPRFKETYKRASTARVNKEY